MMTKTPFSIPARVAAYFVLVLTSVVMLVPLLWAVLTAMKPFNLIFTDPYGVPWGKLNFQSFADVFSKAPFHLYFWNTIKITLACTLGVVVTSALSGYAFARLKFPGREFLFMLFLATMMIPRQITLVPTFMIMKTFGLIDDHLSLILPGLFSVFGTFLLRQFFLTVPWEYEDAAKMDGCGVVRRFLLLLPFAQGTLATLILLQVMAVWNDFLYPMIFLNSDFNRTLTLGLSILRGDMDTQWNLLMAAVVISNIPILLAFLTTQRFVIKGIATTGLKG